jgi:hypothetical protein
MVREDPLGYFGTLEACFLFSTVARPTRPPDPALIDD